MLRKIIFIASLSGLLARCTLPGTVSVPTAYPADYLPTVIYLTAQAINATISAAATPTETPTDTPTPIPPTAAPTITSTPAPGVPLAAIQIDAPGPASKVASPLEIRMLVVAGKSKIVQVNLYGEDGRKLNSVLQRVSGYPAGDNLFVKIPFEIRAAAEVGIIQVSTKDEFGRLQSLTSARVLLLSSGASQIGPAGNAIYERVVLYHLPPRTTISGGVLAVEGKFLPFNRQQMVLELVSSEGKSLGLRLVDISGLDSQTFNTTIPYKVSTSTQARLFIRQADDVLDGPVYVYSQEITLNP